MSDETNDQVVIHDPKSWPVNIDLLRGDENCLGI